MPKIIIGRDEEDTKRYGEKGTITLGKHLVGTGEDAHLTTPVLLDVVRPHIICVMGKTGSGKSFTMGVIAEELTKLPQDIAQNLCSLIIDTQGIFWTMKAPNEKEFNLLTEWGMHPQGFKIDVYVPEGQEKIFSAAGVEYDGLFSIMPSQLTAEDWLNVFSLTPNESLGILLQQIHGKLYGNYTLDDIISVVMRQEGFMTEKLALRNYFEAAKSWGIFGELRMPQILIPKKLTVLDVSLSSQNVRSLLVSIVLRKILEERIKARRQEEFDENTVKHVPMCWVFMDEAHNFIPADGMSPSSAILSRLVKEGRQPGITTVFATQRPEKLHPDVLAQSDMIISHRLTAKADIEALKAIMQTYLLFDISKYISELPRWKGAAIILDDNSERIYKMRVRPRQSWHAGSSPTAV